MMKVIVEAEIDIDDFVKEYKSDIIESLEVENFYVFEPETLADKYKLEWFRDSWQNVSIEELESLTK